MLLRWQFLQKEQVQKAKESLDKAQQLAPDLAETLNCTGFNGHTKHQRLFFNF
jgi:hypothetical protein